MDVGCKLFKIKPDALEDVRTWQATLNARKAECVQTLRDEGVMVESVFLAELPDGPYLVYYIRATDLEVAAQVAGQSTHEIDRIHKNFMQNIVAKRLPTELLLDVTANETDA